ncbi:MAG: CoA-binding protein [Humibacillus sp.]
MSTHLNDPDVIRDLLHTPGTWAVVGLGDNPDRTAYGVSRWLQAELGLHIVPVHPDAATVHGERGYANLAEIPDGTTITVVDCFVNSARVGAVVDEAIAERERLGIEAVWLQLGVVDEDAAQRAEDAGLAVVMDTCPKIEYPRIVPGDGSRAVTDGPR